MLLLALDEVRVVDSDPGAVETLVEEDGVAADERSAVAPESSAEVESSVFFVRIRLPVKGSIDDFRLCVVRFFVVTGSSSVVAKVDSSLGGTAGEDTSCFICIVAADDGSAICCDDVDGDVDCCCCCCCCCNCGGGVPSER